MKTILLFVIRAYQASAFLWKPRCRFWPTCSRYAAEAVEIHGAAHGSALTLKRLSHCLPWGGHGYDPVPSR